MDSELLSAAAEDLIRTAIASGSLRTGVDECAADIDLLWKLAALPCADS